MSSASSNQPLGEHASDQRRGLTNGLLAFGWWAAVFPLLLVGITQLAERGGYFQASGASSMDWSLEFLAHRCIWTIVTCWVLVGWQSKWPEIRRLATSRRSLTLLGMTAALVFANWLGFVYGAATGRLSHSSLGYYLCPLVSVALGVVVLGERLRPVQIAALALAAAGVAWETYRLGQLPWISLLVACAFALYGLFRKQINATAVPGLLVEVCWMLPVVVGYLIYRETAGPEPAFGRYMGVSLLLVLSGVATAAPLIWFANAAKLLPLTSVAFLQFVVPTGQLLIATTLNGEQLTTAGLVSFTLIWLGVAMFLFDVRATAVRTSRRVISASIEEAPP